MEWAVVKHQMLGAIFTALLSANTHADSGAFFDGFTLLKYCQSYDLNEAGMCGGYIAGVKDTTELWESWEGFSSSVCVPDTASIGQLAMVVLKYMEANPELLHNAAQSLVADSYIEAFPCIEDEQVDP